MNPQQKITCCCSIVGKIKPMRGWNKRINPKLFGLAKPSEEDNCIKI